MNAQVTISESAIQVAFSIFIVTKTRLVPVEGWLVDKFGPRPVVAVRRGVRRAGLGQYNGHAISLPTCSAYEGGDRRHRRGRRVCDNRAV